MDNMLVDVTEAVDLVVCKHAGEFDTQTLRKILAKQVWSSNDRYQVLSTLSDLLVNPECCVTVAEHCRPILLDLLHRAAEKVVKDQFSLVAHEQLCIAIGKLLPLHPDVVQFASKYFDRAPSPFHRLCSLGKFKEVNCAELLQIVHASWMTLLHMPSVTQDKWDWSPFLQLTKHEITDVRWYAAHIVSTVLMMVETVKTTFFETLFTSEEIRTLTVKNCMEDFVKSPTAFTKTHQSMNSVDCTVKPAYTRGQVTDSDIVQSVVSVCDILLDVAKHQSKETRKKHLIAVPSTRKNLRSLALAVSSSSPVLLEGPVGCGKTSLVEYLAELTGRSTRSNLLRVQLGDQTDSKALLGTYCCTDIPGEFKWIAGPLTQAVLSGHWILLEDIDYAPMDVVSTLLPLLESRSLSLPGHGNTIQTAPGFQLFATQRLVNSGGSFVRQQHSHSAMLDRMWTRIQVEPLSTDELRQVVVTLYPKLITVADRLLEIYSLISAGGHHGDNDNMSEGTERLSLSGRLFSTRDLIKWCDRIVASYDHGKSHTANMIFLEALDCFCSSSSKPAKRARLGEVIGTKLNVSKEKSNFFSTKYKPSFAVEEDRCIVGRTQLRCIPRDQIQFQRVTTSNFAFTRHSCILLERVAVCINNNEPVLLVGETGTGKTSSIQYLADLTNHRLKVINMNQQSDSADLLGGYKPIDIKQLITPIRKQFEENFGRMFSRSHNEKFLGHIQTCYYAGRWTTLLKLMMHSQQAAVKRLQAVNDVSQDQAPVDGEATPEEFWRNLGERIQQLLLQIKHSENMLAFSFVEGTLVKALTNGNWVLLDEINLATAETLECLSGLLESTSGSVVLMERGDLVPVVRHNNFRLFACMNPATDVGKKELPIGIRNRFSEFFIDELEEVSDLKILVNSYVNGLGLSAKQLDGIVKFYQVIRVEAEQKLTDGTGHRPHYSLRTLCRALRLAAINPYGNVLRSLYESFCLSFLTQLDRGSHPQVEQLIIKHVIGKANVRGMLKQPIPPPASGQCSKIEGYWIRLGDIEPKVAEDYVLTASVKANLRDLVRIVSAGSFPVLIQGETSVGKTSLIQWLAKATGNRCVRVNNHEHTDLQEYVGFYAADEMGKLMFKEGVLVECMRKGYWIILDELNLAPSDVLEALNRLLDDNRELYIPETQETVQAHPQFMLFATQNPAGQYGGRKVLSRAFRNRFVELHFDEIPSRELQQILHDRCALPKSYCMRLVAVMLELQTRRKSSGVFAGKHGYITLRDLFRWAERYRKASSVHTGFYDWDQHLADNGYMLLAGRVRRPEERLVIQEVIEKHMKRKVEPTNLFTMSDSTSNIARPLLEQVTKQTLDGFSHVVWTYSMRRLAVLVGQALKFGEPVLLVGETGCGKTTICQLFAALSQQSLYTVNCHLHTESSDFLGGLRPVRHHDDNDENSQKLFEWRDGPLVQAMREGAAFLIDEISLADDSVLERLNSVLEIERSLLLAEKGSGEKFTDETELIKADERFHVFSTMNPGGDFGKKELSPALRNRFTEIWCPQPRDRNDMVQIIEHNICDGVQLGNQEDGSSGIGKGIMNFVEWFTNTEAGKRFTVSIRDILAWVNFINTSCDTENNKALDVAEAFIHGACLVFLDSLGSGTSLGSGVSPDDAYRSSLEYLQYELNKLAGYTVDVSNLLVSVDKNGSHVKNPIKETVEIFGIEPFFLNKGPLRMDGSNNSYALHAPTTSLNAQRVLRALQLPKAILLEGSPGVGKTSLVSAIARASGHQLVRINLSEQTDVTDLFGADLPVEGGEGGQFAWRDGPLLSALKSGHWIVLDELNLASQSVLEGLNACLDHRAEVVVPELGMTFSVKTETRLFACQNPLVQGGGRKGLPKSFLNRFTQVYIEPLTSVDLLFIATTMYPQLPAECLEKMVEFSNLLYKQTMVECAWGQRGGPWEFNLRDLFRWCDLMVHDQHGVWNPGQHVSLIYSDRLRTVADKAKVKELFDDVFLAKADKFIDAYFYEYSRQFHITPNTIQVGNAILARKTSAQVPDAHSMSPLFFLHHSLDALEGVMKCVEMNWMAILVGPKSCGKTSLVQSLAKLTGNKLQVLAMNSAMDTTELLGGFEQADYNRHWDELYTNVKSVVYATVRSLLVLGNQKPMRMAYQLLNTWYDFQASNRSGSAQANLSVDRLMVLENVVIMTKQMSNSLQIPCTTEYKLSDLFSGIDQLKTKFEQAEGALMSGGGKFEWIDGMLVTALNKGHWLLIDNVNLCSPSVLDRLNGLLEPNGVLSISERGVIDGMVPTITPHPTFRLFLAMDPKHGEISRAMRNRGVEIYILGENEGGAYTKADLTTMLHGIGLKNAQLVEFLISTHSTMINKTTGFEAYTVLDLLRAAALIVQQVERGLVLTTAVRNSCLDVYVQSQLLSANKQNSLSVLEQCLEECSLLNHSQQADSHSSVQSASILSVQEICSNSRLSMISMEATALRTILNQLTEHDQLWHLLQPAVLVYLEQTTANDWKLRSDWLTNIWKSHPALADKAMTSSPEYPDFVRCMPAIVEACLQRLLTSPLVDKYKEQMSRLQIYLKDIPDLPLDMNWNQQQLHMLMTKIRRTSGDGTELDSTILYRFSVLLVRSLIKYVEGASLDGIRNRTQPPRSPLQFSYALNQGLISVDHLPHPSFAHLYPLLQAWDGYIMTRLMDLTTPLTEDQLHELLVAEVWRDRFWQCCNQLCVGRDADYLKQISLHWSWMLRKTFRVVPFILQGNASRLYHFSSWVIKCVRHFPTAWLLVAEVWRDRFWQCCNQLCVGRDADYLKQISLHWSWMLRKTFRVVPFILQGNASSLPKEFEAIASRIYQHFGNEDESSRNFVNIWRSIGHVAPYRSNLVAEMAEHLDTLANCMDLQRLAQNLQSSSGMKALNRCIKFLIQDHGTTSTKVVELLMKVEKLNCNSSNTIDDDVLDEIDQLEAHLVNFSLYKRLPDMVAVDIGMETEMNKATENDANARMEAIVEILPLKQHLKAMAEHNVLCRILEKNVTGVDENYDEDLSSLLTFTTGSCLANLNRQMLLRQMSDMLHDQPELGPCILQAHQKFTQDVIWQAANMQVDFWLSWTSEDEENEHGLWFNGNSLLYSPLLSHCLFKLMVSEGNATVTSKMADKSIATITLGKFKEKNDQLMKIKNILWQCSGIMGSDTMEQRSVDHKSLCLHLCHLLTALSSFVKEEAVERYHQLLDAITAIHTSADQSSLRLFTGSFYNIFHFEGETQAIEFDQKIVKKLPRRCIRLMLKCFELLLQSSSSSDDNCSEDFVNMPEHLVTTLRNGSGFVVLGCLQILLLSPCGPVDPAEKQCVKLAHLKKEALDIERELQVRGMQLQLLTGKTLQDCKIDKHPPRLRFLLKRLTTVQMQIEKLAQNTAARPERCQFHDLVQEINHYKSSIGSEQTVEGLFCDLRTSFYESHTTDKFSDVPPLLRRGRAWLHSQHQFISKLQDSYPLYRDLIQPFLGGVSHLIYGMQLMVEAVERLYRRQSLMINTSLDIRCLENVIQSLTCFPLPSCLHQTSGSRADFLCKEATMQTVLGLARENHTQHLAEPQIDHKNRLLMIILLHLQNHTMMSSYVSPSIMDLLTAIFSTFVNSWQDAQEAAKKLAEEEESLFRFKARVHCEEATDEEQEEMEIKQSFPSFDQDFADLIIQPTLESKPKQQASKDQMSSTNNDNHGNLSQLEMYQLTTIHRDVFSKLTDSHWLTASCSTIESVDYFEVFRQGYQLSACLYDGSMDLLDSNIDAQLCGSHLLQNGLVLAQIHPESSDVLVTNPTTKPFDIYHDPYVSEVAQCRPILEKFTVHIKELLKDWPDHPILKQMALIIKRILSFPVTSSLMKFASGLELLLEKAQEWERNASKAVSLQDHLESVTHMIIQWRKLELKSWEACLETVTYRAAEMSAKWWFQLYQLIQSFLSPNLDDFSPSEKETTKPSGIQELVKALQQFMEAATIGDFECRLSMVFAFHCQVVHHSSSDYRVEIMNVLWNVYKFYRQFLLAVQTEVQKQKKSIEKELKDFVKIAKWNDINFWAMKEAVAKTHRTLHKFSKKFQQALNTPARSAFSDESIPKEMPAVDVEKCSMTNRTNYISPESMKVYFDHVYEDQTQADGQPSLQSRLPSLFLRMTKLCRRIFHESQFTRLTTSLDGFIATVVTTVHDLQALDVTKHEDKEKQKSEAKHINLRKRKALATLFREFTRAGLSYRKGLALTEQEGADAAMELSAVDLGVALKDKKECEDTVRLWQGCEYYFYRSIARKATFFSAIDTPSKELGIGNIERCRGFSEHISSLVVKQRQEIAEVTEDFDHLRNLFEQLQRIKSKEGTSPIPCLPNQTAISSRLLSLQNLLCQAGETLLQTMMLLECCPLMAGDEESTLIPFPVEKLSAMSRAKKGDYTWARVMTSLKQCQERVDSMKEVINPIAMKLHWRDRKYVLTWSDVQVFQSTISNIKSLTLELSNVEDAFATPYTQEKSAMVSSLSCLRNAIDCFEDDLQPVTNTDSSPLDNVGTRSCAFQCSVEALLNRVLLTVQNIQKMETSKTESIEQDNKHNDEKSEEDADDEYANELIESHIKLLTSGLSESKKWMDSKNIKMALKTIISDLVEMHMNCPSGETNTAELNNSVAILLRMVPILHQYLQLVMFHLHQMVSAHRTTSKLLSILLGVFTELATKGFCVPPEFSDEIGEGGATEFEDIEGGGIGAGEGAKDVSDQIENEDQVQDTKKPGDNDEENDANNQPDLEDEEHGIEMSEDFEGKMHDVEKQAFDESGNESEGDDENQLDKQMGDLGNEETDKLDERMWGDDDDEEDEEEKDKEKKDEYGDGAGEEQQSQLVAKDDNQGDESGDKEQDKGANEENKEEENEKETTKPNNLEPMDEEEYDDNVDPRQANNPPPEVVPEELDLPDDLDLDQMKDGDDEDEEKEEGAGENPLDIEPEIPDNKNLDKMDDVEEQKMEQEGEDDNDNTDEQEDEKMNEQEGPDDAERSAEPQQENDDEELVENDPTSESLPDQSHNSEQMPEAAEQFGKSHEETDQVNKDEGGNDETGKSEEKEKEEEHGTGSSQAERSEGHDGDKLSEVTMQNSQDKKDRHRKRPSQSDSDRTLGAEKTHKRLKTIDETKDERQTNNDEKQSDKAELYEHVHETSSHDVETLDTATNEQQAEQPALNAGSDDSDVGDMETDDNLLPHDDEEEAEDTEKMDTLPSSKLKMSKQDGIDREKNEEQPSFDEDEEMNEKLKEDSSENVASALSMYHTSFDHLETTNKQPLNPEEIEGLRKELEEQLLVVMQNKGTIEQERQAQEAWHKYGSLTSSLARDLCEQLRLVLEPTQASKLRGDFRSGKRLNMRKVIPYIASHFRKDKIWLRRSKPSKRQYQIMLAVDDSSSMDDNHSKQLAFESLSVISNALRWLEVGEFSVCSFGESVQLLHPFHEQFTDQSGGRILQQFTFSQKKTKIGQLLKYISSLMTSAQYRLRGTASSTSQLLLVISDGRGLFLEGMETVRSAVRQARDANIFLVFVILDNPNNKDSILDIRVPVFKGPGEMPEIRSYMEHFPFPFYIVLRNISALPETLSDALRQWFELVTAGE
ncbi:midasin-like [Anneissia japonica]|uniref:midasin-like n=1 Tax=Anneissia japonica TaxID=1529436 RepID=UPI0014259EBC|nr:midasin-like [Anneissia japonica]